MLKLGKQAAELRGHEAAKLALSIKPLRIKRQMVALGAITLFVVAAAACGKFFPDAGTLVAITISPNNPTIQPSKTQQFTATGTFGDNSTKDLSSSVTWSSSNANAATINSSGLATAGTSTGVSTTITAKSGNQTASTTLTVSNQSSNGLTITCATGCISGQGTGTFTDLLSSGSVTFTATDTNNNAVSPTWSSSNPSVATFANSSTGLATLLTAGQTTVTAQSSGASGSVTLTVQ